MLPILLAAAVTASSPTPSDTVNAMFAAFNAHDPAAMARLYGPDAVLESSDFCAARGRGDVERTYAALFRDMPDVHDTVETVVADGDRVAVRFTASSERAALRLQIATFLRVRDGLIVEDRSLFDNGGRPCVR